MAMSDNVIEVKNLTKRYGQTTVVKGISFSVGRGEIFGLLGPDGSGKTTTILMLMGLTEISDGQVRLFGHDPAREPLAVKRRIGFLPDAVGFYDNLSAADNLRYTARLNGFAPAEREDRIKSSLVDAGLADVAEKHVGAFSHGMRQRLGVAEILMKGAQVALLDEPTSGLDPQSQIEFLEIIRNLKHKNVSVVLSSHLLAQVQSVCDRVALFDKGRIVLIGTVPELARQVLGGGFHVDVEAVGTNSPSHSSGSLGLVPSRWFQPITFACWLIAMCGRTRPGRWLQPVAGFCAWRSRCPASRLFMQLTSIT